MSEDKKTVIWEISWMSIVRIVLVLVGFYLLLYLVDIFLILFVVVILTSALSPLVDKIKLKLGVPRLLAILLIYLLLLLFMVFVGYLVIPPVVEQIQNISTDLPSYMQKLGSLFSIFNEGALTSPDSLQSASGVLGGIADALIKSATSLFGGLTTVFYILVLTLFLLLEEDGIRKFFVSLLPISQKTYVVEVSRKIADKMGAWVLGQVSLMGIMAVVTMLGLWVLGVPYALTLGIIAGILEIIPTIGPIIAGIPAIFIAYLISPFLAVVVTIFYVIIQQLENQLLVPKIMQKALGISPFVILVALLIGGKLAGILGVILAVPAVASFSVLSQEWPNIRKRI